jgi:hypothetical protein
MAGGGGSVAGGEEVAVRHPAGADQMPMVVGRTGGVGVVGGAGLSRSVVTQAGSASRGELAPVDRPRMLRVSTCAECLY